MALYFNDYKLTGLKMKPFDLEAAKRGEPFQCCGVSAKFVAHEPEAAPYEQFIYMGHGNMILSASCNGRRNGHQLEMAPKKRTVWVNFYEACWMAQYFADKPTADLRHASATMPRLGGKAYPVEIEE
jgi:hypothetical protein